MGLPDKTEILIAGGGIVGLTLARELAKRGASDILILEKEDSLGKHASGRNSGVLHSGIYYAPDSFKARFCMQGNMLLKDYCRERGLPLDECGKVIVTRDEEENRTLKELYERSVANGAKVALIDEKELAEIEPNAKTCERALYSHNTAVVDPKKILASLKEELTASGKVRIELGTSFIGPRGSSAAKTSKGEIKFGLFINSAGAYSDRIAHSFGIAGKYILVPFKGTYKKLRSDRNALVRGNIYPVPDIRNPFLGVHFTKNISGEIYMGPTAIPALGRENYSLLGGLGGESLEVLYRDILLFLSNPKFRKIALTEPRKYLASAFFKDAKSLVKELKPSDVVPSDKAGIRPQLVDWEKKELVMDFIVLKDGTSLHILNAISPAFTCSMAFSEFVAKEYIMN